MQGNRLDDMWPTFRRMMLQSPRRVPSGLRVVWLVFWLVLTFGIAFLWNRLIEINLKDLSVEDVLRLVVGGGAWEIFLTYLVARLLPGWISTSFVDAVRYLDTSPRSDDVRRQIRKGMVELLVKLHQAELYSEPRYQRIIVVAHSLGAFIAYDGITYFWSHLDDLLSPDIALQDALEKLQDLEEAASGLPDQTFDADNPLLRDGLVSCYQSAQRGLWQSIREHDHPWLITDFITLGTPMYFTDRLFTRNEQDFARRIERGELSTCPPQSEDNTEGNVSRTRLWFMWLDRDGSRKLGHQTAFCCRSMDQHVVPGAMGVLR